MKETDSKDLLTMSEEGFYEDPRYKQCNKEALYGVTLGIANLIWWYGFGYGLGSKPVEEYSYILGFPAWFFISCIVGAIVFIALTFVMVDRGMEEMPLDKFTKEEAEEYLRNKKNGGSRI